MTEHQNHLARRIEDTFIGRVARIWPVIVGISFCVYAMITNYNMVKSTVDGLIQTRTEMRGLNDRVAAIEKDMAVKNSQFTVILNRTDRIEDKLDKLFVKKGER